MAAAGFLCRKGRLDEALPVLESALKEKNDWVRLLAADELDRLGPKGRSLLPAKDPSEYVQRVLDDARK